jgi:polygalacturonase
VNGLRIKTDATATGSVVETVTYSGNTLSGISQYGVIIDQSYPSTLGTPRTGVVIEVCLLSKLDGGGHPDAETRAQNIVFSGTNKISVDSSAHRVEVNCGSSSSCKGYVATNSWSTEFKLIRYTSDRTWNFSGLTVTGGEAGTIKNAPVSGGSF